MHERVVISEEERQRVARIWGQSVKERFIVLDLIRSPLFGYDYYVIWLPDYLTTVRCPVDWLRD